MNREESDAIHDLCVLGEVLTTLVRAKHELTKAAEECKSCNMYDDLIQMIGHVARFMKISCGLMNAAIEEKYPYDQGEEE